MIQLGGGLQSPKTGGQLAPSRGEYRALGAPTRAPQNNFTLPGGQANPFTGFNDALWRDTQARTEREGRRATLGEYTAAGGNANDYHKVYGGPEAGAFERLQQQYEGNGGRIPFEAFRAAGFDPSTYGKIYGDNSAISTQNEFNPIFDAQRQSNYQQAGIDSQLNRIDEFNPYGSSRYVQNADGSVSRHATLSDPNQRLLDQQFGQDARRGDLINDLLGNARSSLTSGGSAADMARSAENEVFNRYSSDLDSRFAREREQLRSELLNSGASQTSEKWKRAMQDFEDRKEQSYQGARSYALQEGRAQGNFYNQNRNQLINEIGGLQGQQRGVQNPTFSQNYNVQMPYIDTSTPTLDAFTQNQLLRSTQNFDREMALFDAEQKKELQRIANAGRGGGGGGGSTFDSKLEDYILASAFNQAPRSGNGLTSGLAAGLGTGLGAAIGNAFR